MRCTLMALALSVSGLIPAAAQVSAEYAPNRTISVTGSAQLEVAPDEIYVDITLKEYSRGGVKVPLDRIREDFLVRMRAIRLPDSTISIASYDGEHGEYWWKKSLQKDQNVLASLTYQVLLHSGAQLNDLVDHLDDRATDRFEVARVNSSQITAYRRQLKIDAIRAAKEKARYLAEAIGEQVGQAITITENSEDSYTPPVSYANVVLSNSSSRASGGGEEAGGTYQKLRLKVEISVTFALK